MDCKKCASYDEKFPECPLKSMCDEVPEKFDFEDFLNILDRIEKANGITTDKEEKR